MTFLASSQFRTDIEGLRAVSILAVVFYHAKVPGFSGGFVGVDIFFVISGFLITRLLAHEFSQTGSVDLVRFWARRARRLFPNAVLTLIAILLFSVWLFPPFARLAVEKEVLAATVYLANYIFSAKAIDYFQSQDAISPVLHYWSLSIEEQFYIVWPTVLSIVGLVCRSRSVRTLILIVIIVWVLSFLLSLTVVARNQPAAFFHTETRVWELATGGLIAMLQPSESILNYRGRSVIAWAGLGCIIFAVTSLNDEVRYPGVWALFPTLGCAAIIMAGHSKSRVFSPAAILSLPPLQWLGKRSYSVYLWHWPILVFTQYTFPSDFRATIMALIASVVIATLVFKFVEDPVRRGTIFLTSPMRSLIAAFCLASSLALICISLIYLPWVREGGDTAYKMRKIQDASVDFGRNYLDRCHLKYDETIQPQCVYGSENSSNVAVLFGDSHAAQWFAPLQIATGTMNWKLYAWTKTSCPSVDFMGWNRARMAKYTECDEWREAILKRLTGDERPKVVFLSNLFDYSGSIADRSNGHVLHERDAASEWARGFKTVLQRLTQAGIEVVVIRDTPQASRDYAECFAVSAAVEACSRLRSQAVTGGLPEVEIVRHFPTVKILDLTDSICEPAVCPVEKDGILIYRDNNHLTATYAATLAPQFASMLVGRVQNEYLR